MAVVGLEYLVMAPVQSYVPGSEPTYGAGMRMGKAINAILTITRNNNPLRGDNVVAEDDNGITGISLEIGMTSLTEELAVALGLLKKIDNKDEWYELVGSANEVGTGYLRNITRDGVSYYQAVWNYRGKYAPTSENTETKGESINWQTPTLTGNMLGTEVSVEDGPIFRKKARFAKTARADAIAWLNTMANITVNTTSGNSSGTETGTGSGT